MTLDTRYMGLSLRNPLIVASGPWTSSAEGVRTVARHGAGAVVLKSLFEEQIVVDREALERQEEMFFWYPEAVEYVNGFARQEGLENYLRLIREAKEKVDIPVIASINCATDSVWPEFAGRIEEAGADALELNIYIPPGTYPSWPVSSGSRSAPEGRDDRDAGEAGNGNAEDRHVRIVQEVTRVTTIPVAAKIGFYVSDLWSFVPRLCRAGVAGLVLFNRFYRPDIDIDALRVVSESVLSAPEEITLSLRWVALLSQTTECDLVGATGIHDYRGVAKQLLAGARAVQICSTLLENGPDVIDHILDDLGGWMNRHGFESLQELRGLMARESTLGAAFERMQFMKKSRSEYPGTEVTIPAEG